MSIHVMKSVWDCKLPGGISKNRRSTVKLVLLKLADNSNDNGKCWPSMERIAHETDMSVRSVVRCISELEECNIIKRETRWVERKKHNTYFINIPLLKTIASPFEQERISTDNDNPFMTSDSLSNVDDSLSKVNDSLSHKPSMNRHNNHQENITDIFASQKTTRFIDQLSREDYPNCTEAMKVIKAMKKDGWNVYDGNLTEQEWDECEFTMSTAEDFDTVGYIDWWITKYSSGFTKPASLPDMLCDVNGSDFQQFYDSTYLQQCGE